MNHSDDEQNAKADERQSDAGNEMTGWCDGGDAHICCCVRDVLKQKNAASRRQNNNSNSNNSKEANQHKLQSNHTQSNQDTKRYQIKEVQPRNDARIRAQEQQHGLHVVEEHFRATGIAVLTDVVEAVDEHEGRNDNEHHQADIGGFTLDAIWTPADQTSNETQTKLNEQSTAKKNRTQKNKRITYHSLNPKSQVPQSGLFSTGRCEAQHDTGVP